MHTNALLVVLLAAIALAVSITCGSTEKPFSQMTADEHRDAALLCHDRLLIYMARESE